MSVDLALIGCRMLLYATALFLWGVFVYLACLVPKDLRTAVVERLDGLRLTCLCLAWLAVAAQLPVKAAALGSGWTDSFSAEILLPLLSQTEAGTAWIATSAAMLLLSLAQLVPVHRRPAAIALFAALLLVTLPLSGHAAMHSGPEGILHRAVDGLHLLAGGAWLGALVPVAMILPQLTRPEVQASARRALMRFSLAGHLAVALVLLTGLANTALVLGDLPFGWTSPYRRLLTLKILLVLFMIGLALINRYLLAPRLGAHSSKAGAWLGALTRLEIAAGLIVLGLVAVFGTLSPQ